MLLAEPVADWAEERSDMLLRLVRGREPVSLLMEIRLFSLFICNSSAVQYQIIIIFCPPWLVVVQFGVCGVEVQVLFRNSSWKMTYFISSGKILSFYGVIYESEVYSEEKLNDPGSFLHSNRLLRRDFYILYDSTFPEEMKIC